MSKVDLIIPTHNRTEYLKRILDYYQEYGKDFNFIVADSSNPSNKKLNKTLVKTYPQLNILYVDKFSENLSQHLKFAEMVKLAKSKYVCFCADDDFIVPNGIKECVNFLEKNPEYSAAHGTYIGFHTYKNLLKQKEFLWMYRYSNPSITSSSPLNRLTSYLKDYTLVLWSVRRTDIVKACYREYVKANIDPYLQIILGELLPDALTVVYGKIKHLNTFYAARQYFGSIAYNFASLIDAKNANRYDVAYNKFKNCLISNIIKLDRIPKEEAGMAIDSVMDVYNKFSYQEHLTNKFFFALRPWPKFISEGLRTLHAVYLFSKQEKGKIGSLDNPSSKYYKDFDYIRKLVLAE